MVSSFKWIARAEGISFLVLLFIAMPLKYIWGDPSWVRVVGMAHGVLFVAYIAWAILVKEVKQWGFKTLAIVMFGSLWPFGTFYIEKKYL
jgi:integral membrane protein